MSVVDAFKARKTELDYESQVRKRVKEAEDFLAKHQGKLSGPYELTIRVTAREWYNALIAIVQGVDYLLRQNGPEKIECDAGNHDGGWSIHLRTGCSVHISEGPT